MSCARELSKYFTQMHGFYVCSSISNSGNNASNNEITIIVLYNTCAIRKHVEKHNKRSKIIQPYSARTFLTINMVYMAVYGRRVVCMFIMMFYSLFDGPTSKETLLLPTNKENIMKSLPITFISHLIIGRPRSHKYIITITFVRKELQIFSFDKREAMARSHIKGLNEQFDGSN